jgi:alanine racemase
MGDEVVIFGRQGNETLTVDEMASSLNTINYEIVSTITARVPRVYIK